MEKKIALLVVYNHRFDKNIPRVQNLYKDRFSSIYHIVPFYDGENPGVDVIPVYESSYYFEGYISQAYTHLKGKGFTHFFVIADDLILHPKVNEYNLWECVGANEDECFIPSKPKVFQKLDYYWDSVYDAINYRVKQDGVEVEKILPSYDEAKQRLEKHGFPVGRVPLKAFAPSDRLSCVRLMKNLKGVLFRRTPIYPLVGCYSDIFMVTADVMESFCTYCGAFAATNLFVEVAVPSALVFSSDKIKFDDDLLLHDGSLWNDEVHRLDKYNNNLSSLMNDFPSDKLFIHPVKLSKWN